jgi:preprotein translocase subunit SecA
MGIFKKIFGDENAKKIKKYEEKLNQINALSDQMKQLSDDQLRGKTAQFKERLEKGETLDDILVEAFAVAREAADRTLGERPYDVQVIGGLTIHDGNIAEMRTGEGKTLVATMPTYLNALSGKGVHVITVNDYLARRDAVWMGQVYHFLGLSSAVINQNATLIYDPEHVDKREEKDEERDEEGSYHVVEDFLRPVTRHEGYQADITYGTNSEFGFDYLRDNIEQEKQNLRQRNPNFAIIDEIDSILIDEARTPLIISMPASESENLYQTFAAIARNLHEGEDFQVDEKQKSIEITDAGIEKAQKALGIDNIYTEKGIKYVHHLETAVRAKAIFKRDKQYVVRDNQAVIVDEFTGRLQPSRRWSEGLHQAVEAKEGLPIQQESKTFASITYQNYFRMYEKLAGMTGTAETSAEEFFKVYNLDTVIIPTNKPVARIDDQDLIFQTEKGKNTALVRKIREVNETGQPLLIGTASIDKNEELSELLTQENIPHQLLNAKNHANEAEIIAQAGRKGSVTIATNMAGRGVDIKLGGVPFDQEKYEEVKSLGGLYVIGTERHEARRIDNQLRGRSGRQGDPGHTQFYVSFEDSLMRVFAPDHIKAMLRRMGLPEDQPVVHKMISKAIENAQTKIEGLHFDSRKHVLEYDSVLNKHRVAIYDKRRKILLADMETLKSEEQELIEKAAEAGNENLAKTIEEKKEILGEEEWYNVLRRLILQTIDTFWVEHLETMSYVRSSVTLRSYGQRDPLIEYKKESMRLYQNMLEDIYHQMAKVIPAIGEGAFKKTEEEMKAKVKKAQTIGGDSESKNSGTNQPGKQSEKIGRNDKVTIEKDGETQEMKYKKAEKLLSEGWQIKK